MIQIAGNDKVFSFNFIPYDTETLAYLNKNYFCAQICIIHNIVLSSYL